jgi:hypothetical protein
MLREIPIKKFPALTAETAPLDSADLFAGILQAPRKEGVDIASMRQILKILDALEAVKKSQATILLLDEAAWNFLRARVEENLWAFYHRAFIEVTDDIISAAAVNPNAPD